MGSKETFLKSDWFFEKHYFFERKSLAIEIFYVEQLSNGFTGMTAQ